MAEVLAIASGVAGLLTLTIEVYSTSAKYISGVRDASNAVQDILKELKALKKVLSDLDDLKEYANGEEVYKEKRPVFLKVEDSEDYRELLERLQSKLKSRMEGTAFTQKLKALVWPFSEEKTLRMVGSLKVHAQTFQSALSVDIFVNTTEILKEVKEIGRHDKAYPANIALTWLAPLNMYQKHLDIFAKRNADSGKWFLEDPVFVNWLDGEKASILWCPGDPGSGKTVMTSVILDHLLQIRNTTESPLAYAFCDYQNLANQTAIKLLSTFISQLAILKAEAMSALEEVYRTYFVRQERPGLQQLESLLTTMCGHFFSPILVIDALDECDAKERKSVISVINQLQQNGARILITSRPHAPDIRRAFSDRARLPIVPKTSDIEDYLAFRMDNDEDLSEILEDEPKLKRQIIEAILSASGGMFLAATLQISRICDQMTTREIRRALETMPEGLVGMYQETMDRINSQSAKRRQLGLRVLSWISHAKRPLFVDELRHALAIEYQSHGERPKEMDYENLVRPNMMLDVCAGLVVIEAESHVIRLVHYTTQEYFIEKQEVLLPDTDIRIAGTCLTYLLFDKFREGPRFNDEDVLTRLDNFKFLEYSATHWGDHVRGPLEIKFMDWIVELLENDNSICSAAQALDHADRLFFHWCNLFGMYPKDLKPLQCAASHGLITVLNHFMDKGTDLLEIDGTNKTVAHWAAKTGHISCLEAILDRGVSVDIRSRDEFSLLDVACEYGHENVAKLLLERGFDVNSKGFGGQTALGTSAKMGKESIFRMLLERGASWDTASDFGESPLFLAALTGRDEIVKILIGLGASLTTKTTFGNAPIHGAAYFGNDTCMEILIEAGADINDRTGSGETPVHLAVCRGHNETLKLLVNRGADLNTKANDKAQEIAPVISKIGRCVPQRVTLATCLEGATPLLEASLHGYLDLVRLLVESGADTDVRDSFGRTALALAAEGTSRPNDSATNHEGVLKLFHERGADVNAKNEDEETPLMMASFTGRTEVVKLLLEMGADAEMADINGRTALMLGAMNKRFDVVETLLEHGVDINKQSKEGVTPLMTSAGRGGKEMTQKLIERGADIYTKSSIGLQPIHWAAMYGEIETLKLFLGLKVDINSKDESGKTPLILASRGGHDKTVRFLIDEGADLHAKDENNGTPLIEAAATGSLEVVKVLLEKGVDVDEADKKGLSPLTEACHNGYVEVAEALLDHGAEVDKMDETGTAALADAAEAGMLDVVELLLKRGAEIDKKNNFGQTALHLAAKKKLNHVVELLLNAGANPRTYSGYEQSPMFYVLSIVRELALWLINPPPSSPNSDNQSLSSGTGKNEDEREVPDNAKSSIDKEAKVQNPNHKKIERFIPINTGAPPSLHDHQKERLTKLLKIPIIQSEALYYAVRFGEDELVDMYLEAGADVNAKDYDGTPAFLMIIHHEKTDMAKKLLEKGANIDATDADGRTPLFFASTKGMEDKVQFLLDNGANIDSVDQFGETPLLAALQIPNEPMATFLVKKGAAVNLQDDAGQTAAHHAAGEGLLELLTLLVERGADITLADKKGLTPLHVAAQDDPREIVEFLLKNGADVNASSEQMGTPLYQVALWGSPNAPTTLTTLVDYGADIEARFSDGSTPLITAAAGRHEEVVKHLIDAGADVSARDETEETALHKSMRFSGLTTMLMLLDAGAEIDPKSTSGNTPLSLAFDYRSRAKVQALLDRGADIHIKTEYSFSSLHRAAMSRDLTLVRTVLAKGVDPNVTNSTGCPPSHYAARGHLAVLELLVASGADPDGCCGHNSTPLTLAAELGYIDIVRYLLKTRRVNVNKQDDDGDSSILMAATEGHAEIVEMLLKEPDLIVLLPNKKGDTAVSRSEERGHWEVLNLLAKVTDVDLSAAKLLEEMEREGKAISIEEVDESEEICERVEINEREEIVERADVSERDEINENGEEGNAS